MKRLMDIIKKTSLIIIAFLLTAFSASCASGSGPATTGGVEKPAENINLKDIDIQVQNGETNITLSLLSGSRVAGYPESTLTQTPVYEVTETAQPYRLKIKLEDISFWDYEQKPSWDMSGLATGLFREVPANDNSLIVYVQLTQDVEYTVEESEGSLIIHLKPGASAGGTSYYCVTNAFFEHQEGKWPEDIDMTPVLCSDGQNKLLISQPFASQVAAESFQQKMEEALSAILPGKSISVIQLADGAMPDFITDIDYSAAEGRSILFKDGQVSDTPLLLQNGRFLAASPDGIIAFSRVYQPSEPALEQEEYLLSETLWTLEPNGRLQNVDTPEFFYIDKAAYSYDGRYLAVLDVSIENRVLYVYDFTNGTLINLGEEGFGSQTTSFAWSDTQNALYAMSGYSALQLMACDFSSDGTIKINAVEENAGNEGNIAVFGQRVFFADSVAGQVYEIGETRRSLTTGADIKVSPDGRRLLVLETKSGQDEQVSTSLKLCDVETGDTTFISSQGEIVDFCFAQNNMVYYTDAGVEQTTEGYGYGLYVYDVDTGSAPELKAMATTPKMSAANGRLYFIDYIGDGDNGFYATYVFDPNA